MSDEHSVRQCARPLPGDEPAGDGCGCSCTACRAPEERGGWVICTCWCCNSESVHGIDGLPRGVSGHSTEDGAPA